MNLKRKKLYVYGPVTIKYAQRIKIGNNCRLNDYVLLHGTGGISLGNDVTLSAYAKLISTGYNTNNWVENYIKKEHLDGPIEIADGAWIGAAATILPNVKLRGKGIIVAANSVVTKSFDEDFIVLAGAPAKIVKRLSK